MAEKFAKLKHKGQTRKDGKTPYWKHLQQVVDNLKRLGLKNPDILCAGWLHDTIEDTATDYDDLEEKFGKKVADIVSQLTKDNRLAKKKRELQYIKQLSDASPEAKIVKFCDIVANIMDLKNSGYDPRQQAQQIDDKLRYLAAINVKSKRYLYLPAMKGLDEQLTKYGKKLGFSYKVL